MSTPSNGATYVHRVMVETITDGVPRRVHVWQDQGKTFVSFADNLTEEEANAIVNRGLEVLRTIDVGALFREPSGRRRRFIETEE